MRGPDDQLVEAGDNVTIMCEFSSLLEFEVVWYLNEEILSHVDVRTSYNISTLYLYEVDESNSGNYSCEIDNGILDATTATGELTVGKCRIYYKNVKLFTCLSM